MAWKNAKVVSNKASIALTAACALNLQGCFVVKTLAQPDFSNNNGLNSPLASAPSDSGSQPIGSAPRMHEMPSLLAPPALPLPPKNTSADLPLSSRPSPVASLSPAVSPLSSPSLSPAASPSPQPAPAPSAVPTPRPAPSPRRSPVPTPSDSAQGSSRRVVINGRSYPVEGWHSDYTSFLKKKLPDALFEMAPSRVGEFCKNYGRLSDDGKRQFWADFFHALAKAESGLRITTRYKETSFNYKDAVTGLPVHSEGFLQVSYGDSKWVSCDFEWSKDKNLNPKDPRKTIFDPFRNLGCGMKIVEKYASTRGGSLREMASAYWSVLRPKKNFSGWRRFKAKFAELPSAEPCSGK